MIVVDVLLHYFKVMDQQAGGLKALLIHRSESKGKQVLSSYFVKLLFCVLKKLLSFCIPGEHLFAFILFPLKKNINLSSEARRENYQYF